MKSEAHDVIQRVELAERVAVRLAQLARGASGVGLGDEERGWLSAAESRLQKSIAAVREQLDGCFALPELKSLRVERQQRLEQEWLTALRSLFGELVRQVGPTSPLIDALFPHQRFEKLERGGNALRSFRSEFAPRRGSTYVRRMSADPEYPFLSGLLTPVDRAGEELNAFESAQELEPEAQEALRTALLQSGAALALTVRQARALSEAALIDLPEIFAELAFDERARKRSTRPVSEQALE